jgi:hypothetical protein
MTTPSKAETLRILDNHRRIFLFSLYCSAGIVPNPAIWSALPHSVEIGKMAHLGGDDSVPLNIGFGNTIEGIPLTEGDISEFIAEIGIAARQTYLRMTYETIAAYCGPTKQMDRLKQAPWYWFGYVLRNLVSHGNGGIMNAAYGWPPKLAKAGISEVSWRGRTIKSDPSVAVRFNNVDCIDLCAEQYQFVVNVLN